jgi:hypothetical protein
MAHSDNDPGLPFIAASAMGQGVVVFMNVASARNETVIPADSSARDPLGITIASIATYGQEVAVITHRVAKARAAASVGAGARVHAASTNGALGPVTASAFFGASQGPSAGLVAAKFSVGKALTSAAAGEYFACLVDPQQIV